MSPKDVLAEIVRSRRRSTPRRRAAFPLLLVAVTSAGCTAMPERFQPGSPDIHPRFGYQITNETPSHFDLEVIVMDRSCFYTHGDEQVESARRVFLEFLRAYAEETRMEITEPPPVELNVFQVRGHFGMNSTRVGKRIHVAKGQPDRVRGRRLRLMNSGG